jgi:EAL domain-containing protein (putative c-di-GMP-specific phosphodiesterase class I)
MATDEGDAKIVRSTVQLGRSLGLEVVAEGVEDAASWEQLRALGCSLAQGYHLSRPQPAERLTPWLRTAASTSATGGLSAELTA